MTALAQFIAANWGEFLVRCGEHVVLVAVSTLGAALAGIPAGIAAARHPAMGRPVLFVANVAQTIPSLALFGFLIPLPFIGGVGTRTALVALTLYAVLPIVRATISGLQAIDRAVIECAVAMGMTPSQVLRRIELPLALPSIVGGLRVATVVGVGTAAIASAIGAGGLGDYIFRGLAMVDSTVIMAGALPAAMLALAADGSLALVGRIVDRRRRRGRTRRVWVASGAVGTLLLVTLLVSTRPAANVVVGSKNFTEQVVLGELLAQVIEARTPLTVERRLNLGGTLVADTALRSGEIDVYVEYTGTALTAVLHEPAGGSAREVFEVVRNRYASAGLTVMPALGFNNTFAILMRAPQARELGVTRVSELAAHAGRLRAGFGYEFLERPDGFAGLARTYGLAFAEKPRVMDLNLIYRAVASGDVDVTAGDATSGLIDSLGLVHLADDRGYFPPYAAVPVARAATLFRHPELNDALQWLAGKVSEADMRALNRAVDERREPPTQVVRRFVAGLR